MFCIKVPHSAQYDPYRLGGYFLYEVHFCIFVFDTFSMKYTSVFLFLIYLCIKAQ